MYEFHTSTIPSCTVSEITDLLTKLYGGAVRAGIPLQDMPAAFLWGPPGVGKSDGVRQFCRQLEIGTGKTVFMRDIRLLLFSPVDLRGVPVPDATRTFSDWLKPRIFDLKSGDDTINVIFLDELSAAPQSVSAAAYQIVLDRRVGEHALPDNTIVIAAGNRTTDRSVAFKIPLALANRLLHFDVKADLAAWKQWAFSNGIDSRIIAFLSFKNLLTVEPAAEEKAFPTPRTWAFCSQILKSFPGSGIDSAVFSLISSAIGLSAACDFRDFCRFQDRLPNPEDILAGRCRIVPRGQEIIFAVSASLIDAMVGKGDRISQAEVDNACSYATLFPLDFAAAFFTDLLLSNVPAEKRRKCIPLNNWLQKHQEVRAE